MRSWEFACTVGTRAALLGKESGQFEAWVYPLKILRDFRVRFLVGGRVLDAEPLARSIIVRPESTTIVYASDDFSVRETWFVPVHELGAVVRFDIETVQPLEIEAAFHRDFQLEWPAGFGGTFISWDPALHAFLLSEESKTYTALVGSPYASQYREEFFSNYGSSEENSFRLGVSNRGRDTKTVVIAASPNSRAEAENTYRHLSIDYDALYADSAAYYQNYLDGTVQVTLPDSKLQEAYDWARISMIQGLVANPTLGTGLIAGYRTSGVAQRPGFAWFFGRDSLWTALALDAAGDFTTSKTALDFLSRFQREDGKVPHEIAQTASLVDWFKQYRYGYASADATPLFIIAMNDYVERSGDVDFAKQKWTNLWKAYQFLRSTYDSSGLPQNVGVGHGWVEGGPLLPVKSELYQAGLGAEALRSLANLAHLTGREEASAQLRNEFETQQKLVNQAFWSADQKLYAFAIGNNDKQVAIPSVLATAPMWFGVLDSGQSETMIDELATPDHQTDWGMRIVSSKNPKYDPAGYHYGVVWPLFTGWASVAEYRLHRPLPAYENLRTNALLALDGSPGHVTEVLSGNYYESLSTSSPHQIWSAAMVVSPMLRGMLGLEVDAVAKRVRFAPHLPADWTALDIANVHVGAASIALSYRRTTDSITLDVTSSGCNCSIEFSPAISLRAKVVRAEVNGRRVTAKLMADDYDQHPSLLVPLTAEAAKFDLQLRNDFGVSYANTLPPLGSTSAGLRITSESWNAARDTYTLTVAGVPGATYEISALGASQISSLEGAELKKSPQGKSSLEVRFPASNDSYTQRQVVIHFSGSSGLPKP